METISVREISAKPNYSKRTFTIKSDGVKYRTWRMSKIDFESNLNNTANDWQNFLRTSYNYFNLR